MIHVIATIQVAPGKLEAFLTELRGILPEVRAEAGGLQLQAPVRESVVTILEKWASVAALRAHLQAPHMQQYRSRIQGSVNGLRIRLLQPV
jgi:quinol monooxygenase YgiN